MHAGRQAKPGPRRADARRNREAILRAADEAFAQGTEVVALDEIARRAGLGRATVYRHFPDRRSLGFAVADEHLATLSRFRDAHPDPRSFRDLLLAALSTQVAMRSLVRLFSDLPAHCQRQHSEALIAVLRPALLRAQADGRVRADIEPDDLLLVFEMVEAALGPSGERREDPARRLIQVVVDGLFTRPGA